MDQLEFSLAEKCSLQEPMAAATFPENTSNMFLNPKTLSENRQKSIQNVFLAVWKSTFDRVKRTFNSCSQASNNSKYLMVKEVVKSTSFNLLFSFSVMPTSQSQLCEVKKKRREF